MLPRDLPECFLNGYLLADEDSVDIKGKVRIVSTTARHRENRRYDRTEAGEDPRGMPSKQHTPPPLPHYTSNVSLQSPWRVWRIPVRSVARHIHSRWKPGHPMGRCVCEHDPHGVVRHACLAPWQNASIHPHKRSPRHRNRNALQHLHTHRDCHWHALHF